MELVIFGIGILIGGSAVLLIYAGNNKHEHTIDILCSELARYKQKELEMNMMKDEFHFMKKYFKKIYPNAFKK